MEALESLANLCYVEAAAAIAIQAVEDCIDGRSAGLGNQLERILTELSIGVKCTRCGGTRDLQEIVHSTMEGGRRGWGGLRLGGEA